MLSDTETNTIKKNMVRRKSIIGKQMKEHFVSLITEKMSVLLQMMYLHPDELLDIESGEKYICSVCDMEHKRCEEEPDYRCETARKCETEFKELELALTRLRNDSFGICESCSKFIGAQVLEKNPTRTFCNECARSAS